MTVPGASDGEADAYGVGDFWALRRGGQLDDGDPGDTRAHLDRFVNHESIVGTHIVVWYAAHFSHDPDHEHAGAHGHIVGPTLVPDCLVTHDPDPDHAAIARSQRLSEVTVRKRGSHGLDVLREGARRSR